MQATIQKQTALLSSRQRARALWLGAWVTIAGILFVRAMPTSPTQARFGLEARAVGSSRIISRQERAEVPIQRTPSDCTEWRTKNIEELVVGDFVIAHHPDMGRTTAKRVVAAYRKIAKHLRILRLGSHDGNPQVLQTTNEHPFWVDGKGWVEAGTLKVGQRILQTDGHIAVLQETAFEAHPEGVEVFNLQVEDFHTYYVAAHGSRAPPVLVHNNNGICPIPGRPNYGPGATPGGRPLHPHYEFGQGPNRNIPGSVVDNVIDNYPGRPVQGGKTVYYDPVNDVTVVTGTNGVIISAHKGPPRKDQR